MNEAFINAALGGAIIGVASVLLLWLNGRIAGISGITNGVFSQSGGERSWRLAFVAGLMLGGLLYTNLTGTPLITREGFPMSLIIAAGLLVGFGTSLGSGCTSGHGVCGISRLSVRSLVATCVFVAVGMLTATVLAQLM